MGGAGHLSLLKGIKVSDATPTRMTRHSRNLYDDPRLVCGREDELGRRDERGYEGDIEALTAGRTRGDGRSVRCGGEGRGGIVGAITTATAAVDGVVSYQKVCGGIK